MQTGAVAAVCAVVPIVMIALGILTWSIYCRRRVMKSQDVEYKDPESARSGPRSRFTLNFRTSPRRKSIKSLESKADIDLALDSKSIENLLSPSLSTTAKEGKPQEKGATVKEVDITDMRQMIAMGKLGIPKGRELVNGPRGPVASWSDLGNWRQLPPPRMHVPDDVRLSHFAM